LNVLSLFDGISCGQIALERAGIKVNTYYASEIKKNAIKVTKLNYPNTIHIGDVTKVSYKNGILHTENGDYNVGKIDLLIGGSPCQNFSVARTMMNKKIDGLDGDKSSLFYEYLRLLNEIKPQYFLLENVKMKKKSENELNQFLGVKGIHINSKLVSYQNRERIYWTNIPDIIIPDDKNIDFQDYKDTDYKYCKEFKVNKTPSRERMWNQGNGRNDNGSCANITESNKIYCLTRKQDRCPNSGLIEFEDFCRYLTRRELELAQTVPIGYTNCVSYNQAQDLLGDGWTVDVITHILSYISK
jgi:DNA (cytosine-5)-methyltransferase 3A